MLSTKWLSEPGSKIKGRLGATYGTALGYADAGCHGNAIGPALGSRLLNRGHEIVALGVTDPVIFELIGLFEDDFGADRLSDMTVAILGDDFRAYTQRVATGLDLKSAPGFQVLKRQGILAASQSGRVEFVDACARRTTIRASTCTRSQSD